jgi:hypothetical protein
MGVVYKKFHGEIAALNPKIEQVARHFGGKNVADLERVATAIYITLKQPRDSFEMRAVELNRLKPHISLPVALASIREADQLLQGALKSAA